MDDSNGRPGELGYEFPAEWARHEVTWLSWPNARGASFPGETLGRVLPAFHRLVAALVEAGENVAINVSDDREREDIERALPGETLRSVSFHPIPTNEPWVRDHGPTVLRRKSDGSRRAVCWNYNSWGEKYPPWDLDAAAGEQMAKSLGIERAVRKDLTVEGGSLEPDGEGLLMISETSVVGESRNPGRSRDELEEDLRAVTGAREVLWVKGEVPGDDTDGHVDCFARFAPGGVLLVLAPSPAQSEEHPVLTENARFLESWASERGRTFRGLPLPDPIRVEGNILPATYANFYVANEAVIVPTFGDPRDGEAAALIGDSFPDRRVLPFPARELIWGQGGIHCLTQPLPA